MVTPIRVCIVRGRIKSHQLHPRWLDLAFISYCQRSHAKAPLCNADQARLVGIYYPRMYRANTVCLDLNQARPSAPRSERLAKRKHTRSKLTFSVCRTHDKVSGGEQCVLLQPSPLAASLDAGPSIPGIFQRHAMLLELAPLDCKKPDYFPPDVCPTVTTSTRTVASREHLEATSLHTS